MQMLLPFVMLLSPWHPADESPRNMSVPARVNLGAPMPMLPNESEVVFHVEPMKPEPVFQPLFHTINQLGKRVFLHFQQTGQRLFPSQDSSDVETIEVHFHLKIDVPKKGLLAKLGSHFPCRTPENVSEVKLQMPYAQD